MKILKQETLTPCDFCNKTTEPMYDVPYHGTSWANICANCFTEKRGPNYNIGYEIYKKESSDVQFSIEERDKLEQTFANGFDLDDESLMDSIQPTACPEGCEVDPDGTCCHGFKSISLLLGIL